MTNELLTQQQAANELGMTYAGLASWLYRHPQFRPAGMFGRSSVWTRDEIEAVRQERNARKPDQSDAVR